MATNLQPRRIPVANPVFCGNEKKYVNDCLDSGWISSAGEYIARFEKAFGDYCTSPYALSCSNGTVALHLALLAYGIGPGDEVIVPTLTYIATANAVRYCNATPVFADSEPETWNANAASMEKKITSRTKGIIVVHLYGHPVDMDPILALAKARGLFVIEDAAEAHGALYKDKKAGSIGDIATFSFFGNKVITTGEGGMILTKHKDLADKMRLLKGQGMDPKRRYWFPEVGYNYRMTNIQAAIGLAQLEKIDWQLERRRWVADSYNKGLGDLREFIELPFEAKWAKHSFWMYSIVLKPSARVQRDALMAALDQEGVETRPIFYPMHVMPPYLENARYPVAERIAANGINLPTHSALTESDIDHVCGSLKKRLTGR